LSNYEKRPNKGVLDFPSGGEMFFESESALLRTLVVGSLAYVALVLLLRFSGKRTLSKWNAFDLVVTVAFGSTLATAFLSKDTTLSQGVLAFGLLVGLQWSITWLSVRSRTMERWVKAQPRLLLFQGRLQQEALQQERVTESEIRAALRAQGITALEDVEAVVLETDGSFSVLKQRGSSASALADVQGYPHAASDTRRG
jgi:uncharacterized membrane protein YcaP (DUF421 family)